MAEETTLTTTALNNLTSIESISVNGEQYYIDPTDGRVYRRSDDHFAFILSPGFGAGWSYLSDYEQVCLFHPFLVWILLTEKEINNEQVEVLLRFIVTGKSQAIGQEHLLPTDSIVTDDNFYHYCGGWPDCEVIFLPRGTKFRVNEYDGSESYETQSEVAWN